MNFIATEMLMHRHGSLTIEDSRLPRSSEQRQLCEYGL